MPNKKDNWTGMRSEMTAARRLAEIGDGPADIEYDAHDLGRGVVSLEVAEDHVDTVAMANGEMSADGLAAAQTHLGECEPCADALLDNMQIATQLSVPQIEALPDVLRCSEPGCGAELAATEALDAGWVIVDGKPYCRGHRPVPAPMVDGVELPEIVDIHDEPTVVDAVVVEAEDVEGTP